MYIEINVMDTESETIADKTNVQDEIFEDRQGSQKVISHEPFFNGRYLIVYIAGNIITAQRIKNLY